MLEEKERRVLEPVNEGCEAQRERKLDSKGLWCCGVWSLPC